jgi:hypothetical protein
MPTSLLYIESLKNGTASLLLRSASNGLPDAGSEMFAAVISAPNNSKNRQAVRDYWKFPDGVAGKFVLCSDPPDQRLVDENQKFKDIMLVNCSEGYREGKLTKKVYAAMEAYLRDYGDTKFLYKGDDDTLPNLRAVLENVREKGDYVYGGVMYTKISTPNTDPASPWYEPVFRGEYPASASGGAGYVLSNALVNRFVRVDPSTTLSNMLWNEDKAIGLWVHLANQTFNEKGQTIAKVAITGTDGYRVCKKKDYLRIDYWDLVLKHHLNPEMMSCVANAADTVPNCLRCEAV